MVSIHQCPICNNPLLTPFVTCKDYTVSYETFTIQQCLVCGLGVTTPRPDEESLPNYYLSDNYISHSGSDSGLTGILYRMARSFTLRWKASLLPQSDPRSILDVGCGTGQFINYLKKGGWKVTGIEPSPHARKKAQNLTNEVIHESLNSLTDQSFSVVTFWHVLEHVPDLNQAIKKIKSLLHPTGTLFIAVPNYESPDALHYKNHWAGYDVPRHLWHFTKRSMHALLATHGMKIVTTIPMKLDAYYVSLLSEKYRSDGSLLHWPRALFHGFRSNWKARNGTNYSSVIYIATIS